MKSLDIAAYDYCGFSLIQMPSGVTLVHRATAAPDATPDGPIVHQAASLPDAMTWVIAQVRSIAAPAA